MKDVFVIGSDDFNLRFFRSPGPAQDAEIHPLLGFGDFRRDDRIVVEETLQHARERLREFPGAVDAIVGYGDFPISTILPILRRELGLVTPSLESVLKCEHKYWSRCEQAGVIPDNVPAFAAVDPFADDPLAGVDLEYPFWLKPVKAVLSHLGFKISSERDFRDSLGPIRNGIGRFAEPFDYVLGFAELPEEIRGIDGWHCIAEQMVSTSRQCTVEGYVYRGEAEVYGIVDAMREGPHESNFNRYQYPSDLPQPVQERIAGLSRKVMRRIGYDNAPFNIEFFWDEDDDRLWLLEVNPRLSKSHCPLFWMVDGACHFKVLLDVSLGRRPEFPRAEGRFRKAAKFMVRKYRDARVTRVPTADELRLIEEQLPGVLVQVEVDEGTRLSEMPDQDSYSYEVAVIFVGANDDDELVQKYEQCLERLPIEFEDLGER